MPPARSWSSGPIAWWRPATTFFALPPSDEFRLDGDWLTYPSAVDTPHADNNLVRARYFPERSPQGRNRAVIVLPQWNADAEGHVGLCHLLNRFKISALRLSLPYHDARKPPELRRADYIVSSNVGRTAQVCRQAVLDARRGVAWLASQGYESIGILGTSLGSCLAMLTAAHEPLAARRGPEPHLAVLRRRRLVGALDGSRAAGPRRPHRPATAPADLDADFALPVPRAACGGKRLCWSMRATT